MKFKQGYYTPKYPEKYIGNINKIRYMSSWELKLHNFLDCNQSILRWSSECIAIPYIKPTDQKIHKYYPDYFIEYETRGGSILKEIIEVKPFKQTNKPKSRNKKTREYDEIMYAINIAKWSAAKQYCDANGIKFRILTEKQLLV